MTYIVTALHPALHPVYWAWETGCLYVQQEVLTEMVLTVAAAWEQHDIRTHLISS